MTVCNIRPAATSAKYSWARLAAMTAGLLLATVGAGGRAFAAVGCDAKSADIASTRCLAHHHTRAAVHSGSKTQKTVNANAAAMADRVSEGDELTPGGVAVSSSQAAASQSHAAPTVTLAAPSVQLPHATRSASSAAARLGRAGAGPSPWRAHGAPADNRWPPSTDMLVPARAVATAEAPQSSAISLRDIVHGAGGIPGVPAPAAWAILLMGLLGLTAIARQPRVARAQSWAMTSPSLSVARSAAGIGAVDRVDPTRYAQGPARRSHQGHFVRSGAASSRFGVDA